MNLKYLLTLIFIVGLLSGCNSYKNVRYVNGVESIPQNQLVLTSSQYVARIMPRDQLTITVNTTNPTVAVPFNLPLTPLQTNGLSGLTTTMGMQTYIVDNAGNINFPVLGNLNLAGKTRIEAEEFIMNEIYPKYITEKPIISVRFVNYKISVLGEVSRPGTYYFSTDRVNLFDALASAGDLTIYGKRDNVLLRRENPDGTIQFLRLDLKDKDLVLSPYFYLQQNDQIYVEPNKARSNASSIGAAENLTISVVSVLISVATLVITSLK